MGERGYFTRRRRVSVHPQSNRGYRERNSPKDTNNIITIIAESDSCNTNSSVWGRIELSNMNTSASTATRYRYQWTHFVSTTHPNGGANGPNGTEGRSRRQCQQKYGGDRELHVLDIQPRILGCSLRLNSTSSDLLVQLAANTHRDVDQTRLLFLFRCLGPRPPPSRRLLLP